MTFVILNPTLALTNEDQRQKAETLINILATVQTSTDEAFSRLNAQNIPVPQTAETKYNEGIAHAEEAASLMSEENYSEASAEAVEAMQDFEEALRILQEASSPEEPTETEVTAEKLITLKANITRAFEYVERLENLTANAAAEGYNTTEIESRLSVAKKHLETATRELDRLNLDRATEELRTARTLLNELKEFYNRLVNAVKAMNTQRYLEEAARRINATKANITASATLSPHNKTNAITALNNSENNLANARDLIKNGMIDEAIRELEAAKRWEDESHKYLPSVSVAATPTDVETGDKNPSRTGPTVSK